MFEPVMLNHLLTFQIKTRRDIVTFSLHTLYRVELCNVFGYPLYI